MDGFRLQEAFYHLVDHPLQNSSTSLEVQLTLSDADVPPKGISQNCCPRNRHRFTGHDKFSTAVKMPKLRPSLMHAPSVALVALFVASACIRHDLLELERNTLTSVLQCIYHQRYS